MATLKDNEMDHEKKRIVIVGAGLVGTLEALFCAQRNYKVDVYEHRPDPRKQKYVTGRSINLTLSERGRASLRAVGIEKDVVKIGIPIYARMIHSYSGIRTPMPYGKDDQYILSIERQILNKHLISLVDSNPNVNFHFNDKLVGSNLKTGVATFENEFGRHDESGHLIIGCDGAFSNTQKELMKTARMNYSQEYIPHGYKELRMPPTSDGDFAMEANYLHIWPRDTFMMIALPNPDKTFTITLFMPYKLFNEIQSDEDISQLFEREFPDSIPLIGKENIIKEYHQNSVSGLINIKCSPYHYNDKAVIIGDAAHAMVPFYGQGMNCGFEDCLKLHEILDLHPNDLAKGLSEYSRTRNPDLEAIIDLAMYNYLEMRKHVNSPLFALRRKLDNLLHRIMPRYWIPLYTMTTFTLIPYKEVTNQRKKQDLIMKCASSSTGILSLLAAILGVYALLGKRN